VSTKEKTQTRSSTEAELVSIDDVISTVMWIRTFMELQGYDIQENIKMVEQNKARISD
jgi:hypothetical protein